MKKKKMLRKITDRNEQAAEKTSNMLDASETESNKRIKVNNIPCVQFICIKSFNY